MVKRTRASGWARLFTRGAQAMSRAAVRAGKTVARKTRKAAKTGKVAVAKAVQPALARQRPPRGPGDWIAGIAMGAAGARRYHLYRPPGVTSTESLPLMVMLHGCGQEAKSFAASTRMNAIAARERFLVLYPEQERLANAQGCWNWFDTRSGRAQGEVALILAAIDQVCQLYGAERGRVAIGGLSAGASMAALAALRHPERFRAVVMHSGVRPGAAQSSAGAIAAMQGRRASAPQALERAIGPTSGLSSALASLSTPLPASATADLPPLLVIQGASDHLVVPANARAAASAWAHAGDVGARVPVRESAARHVQRGQRHATQVVDFKRGGKLLATLVEVAGLGHAWSGGLRGQPFSDPLGPDASRMAWAFVAKRFD